MHNPNFYCIGAQKAGTTTLHDILKQHSQIFLPENKEAHFFDQEERYKKGMGWYLNTFFPNVENEKAIGSFTPEYIFFPSVAQRLYEYIGSDLKFIVILRQPVERALSHYKMSYFRGYEKESFLKAITLEEERIKNNEWDLNHFSYLNRGLYYKQLSEYLKYFPIDNFLFLVFEKEIKQNIDGTVKKIQDFLGVDIEDVDATIKSNAAKSAKWPLVNQFLSGNSTFKSTLKYLIPAKVRPIIVAEVKKKNVSEKKKQKGIDDLEKAKLLKKYYMKDIKKLEDLTGLNLDIWYKK